jgi:hypothetical protein
MCLCYSSTSKGFYEYSLLDGGVDV